MQPRALASLLIGIILLIAANTPADATGLPFGFTATTGTATDMSDATSFGFSVGADDQNSAALDIGFSFTFCGTDYTEFSVNTNGCIGLGSTPITWEYSNGVFPSASAYYNRHPMIAPMWEDWQVSNTGGSDIRYMVEGVEPNRVLVIEWKEMKWAYDPSIIYTFQARLYETSNVIEFLYVDLPTEQMTTGTIGMATSASNFISVTPGATPTVSGTSANNAINLRSSDVYLPDGTMYVFDPCSDISLTFDYPVLWPANHQMVTVTATINGPCEMEASLVSITSNEPDDANGNGDGNTVNDIQIREDGDGLTFDLRAERGGGGEGRTYTATYRVTDNWGNEYEVMGEVFVPHDNGGDMH